eukprot:comp12884_c0_seq1/m.8073 comp12884_c0_seq1/g.8073  ORF comp12884_c0_seq1/g.8073 comp12884_c0_seq1/m.8073 type:complete len:282 (-) comp12884_c0_seq1:688-1533(-)
MAVGRLTRLFALLPRAFGARQAIQRAPTPLSVLLRCGVPNRTTAVAKGLVVSRVLVGCSRPAPSIFGQLRTSTRALSHSLSAWRSRVPSGQLIRNAFGPKSGRTLGLAACLGVCAQVSPAHTEPAHTVARFDLPLTAVALRLTAKGGILEAPRDPKTLLAVAYSECQRLHFELSRQAQREEESMRVRKQNEQILSEMVERERRLRAELAEKDERSKKETERLKEECSRLERERECVVCLEGERRVVYGCGHLAVCVGCDGRMSECPCCRREVTVRIPYFLP